MENISVRIFVKKAYQHIAIQYGGARGVTVIGDTSSNPGREMTAFHIALIPLGKV